MRTWELSDAQPYWIINQDVKVVEFLSGSMTMEEVKQFMDRANQQQETKGFTLWATELKETHELIGFIGLNYPNWDAHFLPAPEISWRLGSQFWGKGYATEGARAALAFGFNTIKN